MSEFNFEANFTCLSWPLDFISSAVIKDKQRQNEIVSVKDKASLASQLVTIQPRSRLQERKNVASTAISTTSTTPVVNINIQPQFQ